jgi:hypothetical protein
MGRPPAICRACRCAEHVAGTEHVLVIVPWLKLGHFRGRANRVRENRDAPAGLAQPRSVAARLAAAAATPPGHHLPNPKSNTCEALRATQTRRQVLRTRLTPNGSLRRRLVFDDILSAQRPDHRIHKCFADATPDVTAARATCLNNNAMKVDA